jgi:prepilin-type N-terminal cleavage/methylation domain-containing protein
MQRTSPVRTSSSAILRAGFTLIETVIALALCALVAGITAASLHAALGAERQAVKRRDARRAGDQLQQALLSPEPDEVRLAALRTQWSVTPAEESSSSPTQQVSWTRWTLQRLDDSSQQEVLFTRE